MLLKSMCNFSDVFVKILSAVDFPYLFHGNLSCVTPFFVLARTIFFNVDRSTFFLVVSWSNNRISLLFLFTGIEIVSLFFIDKRQVSLGSPDFLMLLIPSVFDSWSFDSDIVFRFFTKTSLSLSSYDISLVRIEIKSFAVRVIATVKKDLAVASFLLHLVNSAIDQTG